MQLLTGITHCSIFGLPVALSVLELSFAQPRVRMASQRVVVQVSEWLIKLGTVSEIMEQWFQVQNVWTYMEAVFSGGDIVKQLPQVRAMHRCV